MDAAAVLCFLRMYTIAAPAMIAMKAMGPITAPAIQGLLEWVFDAATSVFVAFVAVLLVV